MEDGGGNTHIIAIVIDQSIQRRNNYYYHRVTFGIGRDAAGKGAGFRWAPFIGRNAPP